MPAARSTLDPKLDIVFWMLFALERNRALLRSLLSAVLQPSTPIEEIQVLDPELDISAIDEKGVVLDLRVALATGEQVDIEMQSRAHPGLRERIVYYLCQLHAGQLTRGSDYTELRRTAVVLFADFCLPETQRFHSIFRLYERHDHHPLGDQLEVHLIELPRLLVGEPNDEPSLALWCKFLSAPTDVELELLADQDPIMKQAKTALEELSADPLARQRAELRKMSEIAYHTGMNGARREGEAVGRAQGEAVGRVRGKAEMLQRLLSAKFGALPESTTQRLHTATEVELDHWLDALFSATRLKELFEQER